MAILIDRLMLDYLLQTTGVLHDMMVNVYEFKRLVLFNGIIGFYEPCRSLKWYAESY